MNIQQTPNVLIAYPENFNCYQKFERKVSSILSETPSYRFAIVADHNKFVVRYCSMHDGVKNIPIEVDLDHMKGVTHAIIFSDGESHLELIEYTKRKCIKSRIIEVSLTKVANRDRGGKYDIYIGRGTKWGNPYAIGIDGDRNEVIRKFKYDFERRFLNFDEEEILELRGKTLGCHCKPAACHGDVIAEYLNTQDDEECVTISSFSRHSNRPFTNLGINRS